MAKQKLETINPIGLRLQPDLKMKLDTARKMVPQSLNAEIVERLEQSFQVRHELEKFSDGELIDELIRRWGREAVYIQLGTKPTSQE